MLSIALVTWYQLIFCDVAWFSIPDDNDIITPRSYYAESNLFTKCYCPLLINKSSCKSNEIVYLNANQTNFNLRCFAEWLVFKMWSLSKAWKWDFTFFHVQDCNLKLFQNKCFRNVVKSFYTASLLYDVLTQFGELSEEVCDASFVWVTLKSKIINHDFNILWFPPTFVDIWIYSTTTALVWLLL